MQMVEPDYWKGKGRYSKQELSRKVKDENHYLRESSEDNKEAK